MWRDMWCVRNHVEVKSEEEVVRGVQWSNQHMISGAVSCVADLSINDSDLSLSLSFS